MRSRLLAAGLAICISSACSTKAAAPPPAQNDVEIVSATDHHEIELLNTKILDELKNPLFGGIAVKGTAEWQKAAAGYASSLKLAAQAIDAKGFTLNVDVHVNAGVSDEVVAESKLATDAAKQFVDKLAAQMRANARLATGQAK